MLPITVGEYTMFVIVGLLFTLLMVFGGYTLAGGKFGVILHALPFETMMIMGAAIGSFLMSHPTHKIKATVKSFGTALKGSKYTQAHYIEWMGLLFEVLKLIKTKGLLAVEAHIEKFEESPIFQKYPLMLHDHHTMVLLCDTLRALTMNMVNPHQVGDYLEAEIEKHHHEHAAPAHCLQGMADALPALGIVAAVLGVIKTMSSINQPTEILGMMIGGALVGTFLGVFFAYCIVAPLATRLGAIYDEESKILVTMKEAIVYYLHGAASQVCVEVARSQIPGHLQPSFQTLEAKLNEGKA
jgi:chemotaxis protein MotA